MKKVLYALIAAVILLMGLFILPAGAAYAESPAETTQISPAPIALGNPTNQRVYAGETVKFTFYVQGNAVSYRWQYSTNQGETWTNCTSSGSTSRTFSFTASMQLDDRLYRCIATDNDGVSLTSASALLIVYPQPTITATSTYVKSGEAVSLSASALGSSLTYQWQYSDDGSTWKDCSSTGYNKATFSFSASSALSGRYYRCQVTNPNGVIGHTGKVRLSVLSITTQPTAKTASPGSAVNFTVKATGLGRTYQWQYSDNGTTWKNCSSTGYNKANFGFTASAALNGRYYRCVVKDGKGNSVISSKAKLTVSGPAITKNPTSIYAKAGAKVSFTVAASGTKLKYQWQYSGDGTTWKNCTSAGYNTPTFSFEAPASASGRYYRCRVTGSDGLSSVSSKAQLSVLSITSQPTSKTVAAGNSVSFTVKATGLGLTYQWQFSDDGTTWKNCSSTGYNTRTFSFTAKTSLNGRYYRCVVKDGRSNSVTTNKAKLTAYAKPAITKQPAAQYVKPGVKASFNVTATGTGLKYQWQFSDNGTTWKNCSSTGYNTKTFSFSATAGISGRYYRCKVTDSYGNTVASSSVRLSVLSITTQPKAKTVATGSTVSFAVNATGLGLTYQWQYSDNGTTWINCKSSGYNKATFSFTASASLNGRSYRCIVKDGKNNSVVSSKAKLTAMAKPVITTQPRSRTLYAGETVSYYVSATGTGIKYQWQYSDNGTTWKNCSSAGSNNATFSFTASNALDGRQYRCVVSNDVGKATSKAVYCTLIKNSLGCAEKIYGRTVIISIFANDARYSWDWSSSADVSKYWDCLDKMSAAVDYLEMNVADYGKSAEFIYDWSQDSSLAWSADLSDYYLVRFDGSMAWKQSEYIMNNFDPGEIKAKYDADNVVYYFFFNTPEHIPPLSTDSEEPRSWEIKYGHTEFVNLYVQHSGYTQPPSVYAHEMLHTFGAPDLYYASSTITQEYIDHLAAIGSSDIMYTVYSGDTVTNEFSQLDAYYVGLTSYSYDVVTYGLGKSEHY